MRSAAPPSKTAVHPALRVALALFAFIVLPASSASAGGFYLMPRGSRGLSMGGAYVAGVEDPHALWYNPAGLAYSGDQILVDATLSLFEASFTRTDASGNPMETAYGYHPYLPIPTLGGSFTFDDLDEWTFGLSAQAPNAALTEWSHEPDAPQRYSLISLEGSLLASVALGAAWRPIPELSIGLATHLVVGSFDATVALSACDGVICSFPEDPEYDAVANISLPAVYPFFVLGTTIDLDMVRIGFSISTPYNLEGSASVRVRPPSAAAFDGAETVNRSPGCDWEDVNNPCRDDTRANVQLEFPMILRLGVEVKPLPELRIELAGVYETWSFQDVARIEPQNVWIQNALGGALEYQVGPLNIPRMMNDTVSVRLGGEYIIEEMVAVRLGVAYENGAFSNPYLTPLTLDSDKVVISGGVGIDVSDEVSIDLVGGYLWMAPRTVTDSVIEQSNPIRPPMSENEVVYIGNGSYSMGAGYFGLGVRIRLDGGHLTGPGSEAEEEGAGAGSDGSEPATGDDAPEDADAGETGDDSGTPWYLRGEGNEGGEGDGADPESGAD